MFDPSGGLFFGGICLMLFVLFSEGEERLKSSPQRAFLEFLTTANFKYLLFDEMPCLERIGSAEQGRAGRLPLPGYHWLVSLYFVARWSLERSSTIDRILDESILALVWRKFAGGSPTNSPMSSMRCNSYSRLF